MTVELKKKTLDTLAKSPSVTPVRSQARTSRDSHERFTTPYQHALAGNDESCLASHTS